MAKVRREINTHKKVVGKNSYEMAVEAGTFTGTKEEYIAKEQKIYDDMVEYTKTVKEKLDHVNNAQDLRLNDLGLIELKDMDNIHALFKDNPNVNVFEGVMNYSCRVNNAHLTMIIGLESETQGVQMSIDMLDGLCTRKKIDGKWERWMKLSYVSEEV